MTRRDFSEQDVHLALDGELTADDHQAFVAWLDLHPDVKARSARYAADRERLRETLAPLAAEPVPDRFALLIDGRRRTTSRFRILRQLAAALLAFALGGIGGYLLGSGTAPGPTTPQYAFADSAIRAHDMYSAEKLHVVEVKADQRDHLIGWLSKRVGVALVAPDLSSQGYELLGGRLLPEGGKAAAQFMYQDASGERVSLYVTREIDQPETGFRSLVEGDTRAFYWMEKDYGCAITGAAPEQKLMSIADSAYRQLLAAERR